MCNKIEQSYLKASVYLQDVTTNNVSPHLKFNLSQFLKRVQLLNLLGTSTSFKIIIHYY